MRQSSKRLSAVEEAEKQWLAARKREAEAEQVGGISAARGGGHAVHGWMDAKGGGPTDAHGSSWYSAGAAVAEGAMSDDSGWQVGVISCVQGA